MPQTLAISGEVKDKAVEVIDNKDQEWAPAGKVQLSALPKRRQPWGLAPKPCINDPVDQDFGTRSGAMQEGERGQSLAGILLNARFPALLGRWLELIEVGGRSRVMAVE